MMMLSKSKRKKRRGKLWFSAYFWSFTFSEDSDAVHFGYVFGARGRFNN